VENGNKSDLPDIANLRRLIQMQQFHQNPMLTLGQSSQSNQLSSLMGLNSSTGTVHSAGLLAQLEGLSSANRNPTQGDQQGTDISALANTQSLLRYTNNNNSQLGGNNTGSGMRVRTGNSIFHHNNSGGGNSAPSDGTNSPHNHTQTLPQHNGVSDAFALLTRAMQRENGNNQHGFGASDRQGQ